MIYFKIDVLEELKKAGYTTYRLRKENLLSEGTVQKLREENTRITLDSLDAICTLLRCQPGDLLEWTEDPKP